MNKRTLGDRMKEDYEYRSRYSLTRRVPVIIRVDMKAGHTYTRGMERPYAHDFVHCMDEMTKYVCSEVQGCKLGYTQSDEASFLLIDYDTHNTAAWFDYGVQKMASVVGSLAATGFNRAALSLLPSERIEEMRWANFDARVFNVPQQEVNNYFIYRQRDAVKNSIAMLAQSVFSHRELHRKNTDEMQHMLFTQWGINWNDQHEHFRRGRMVHKTTFERNGATRTHWVVSPTTPEFSKSDIVSTLLTVNNT